LVHIYWSIRPAANGLLGEFSSFAFGCRDEKLNIKAYKDINKRLFC